MTQEIAEVKAMIECANRFLMDEATIHELHGRAQQLKAAAHLFRGGSAISNLAEEWIMMSYRYWNEWGDVEEPISKEEFKVWLSKQIGASNPRAYKSLKYREYAAQSLSSVCCLKTTTEPNVKKGVTQLGWPNVPPEPHINKVRGIL